MGRSMLFLATGATMIFGMVKLSLNEQGILLVQNTANYASDDHSKNVAFTTIQLAMEKINQDENWQPTQDSPWTETIAGADISLYYEVLGTGATILDPDTIKVYSSARYLDQESTIVSTFTKQALDFVPDFEAALSIATDQFTFGMGGSTTISGNEASGTCSDKAAITVPNSSSKNKILGGLGSKLTSLIGLSSVEVDPSITYSPVDELIARLESNPGTQQVSGNYKGDLGSENDPGVFFVDNYAKLTGGLSAGYGIMVIRSGGELEYDGALSVAGNFEFNGLIIFENAFDFTGRGTPDINGSVLIGTTDGSGTTLDIDLSGNLSIQYDCSAQSYAEAASASLLKQNRYKMLHTFE
jgi:hypothetical protein